ADRLGALGAVGLGVGVHHLDLLAQEAAGVVDLLDADHRCVLGGLVIGLHEAGLGGGEADDDAVVVGQRRRGEAGGGGQRDQKSFHCVHSLLVSSCSVGGAAPARG